MNDRERIKNMILNARKKAQEELSEILNSETMDYDKFHVLLRKFVMIKYRLSDEDMPVGENFNEIAEISLAKTLKMAKELVEEFENAQSCDGTTSTMAKKVLLFRAIERGLDIEIPAMESARVGTMSDLTRLVWDQYKLKIGR